MSGRQSPTGPEADLLSRLVAVGAVMSTLLAGLVAFLLVASSGQASDAGLDADKLGLRAMGELTRTMTHSEAAYETFLLGQQLRVHRARAHHEGLLARGAAPRHDLAQRRWAALAVRTDSVLRSEFRGLPRITLHKFSLDRDPDFPERFFAAATEHAVELAARQDAANEEAASWGARSSVYVAVLTMFGVALYLFALLSVSLQTDVKRVFAVAGAVLLVAGTAWAAVVSHPWSIERADDVAARDFAAGHVALAEAHGPQGYTTAIEHYTDAINRRRSFARAYFERAEARFLKGSPHGSGLSLLSPQESLETVTSRRALELAHRDLQKAHELGLESSVVLGQLGFNEFLRWWWSSRTSDRLESDTLQVVGVESSLPWPRFFRRSVEQGILGRSIEYSDQAIDRDPSEPVWHYNRGLALLAAGRYADAREAYDQAVGRTVSEPSDVQGLLEAEALSSLALLPTTARPELSRHIRSVRALIVVSVSRGVRSRPGPSTGMADVRLTVAPSEVEFTLDHARRFLPDRDVLAAQLYYVDTRRDVAYAIPEVSGRLDDRYARGAELHYLTETSPQRCLPDGRYRLELFVNGRLVAETETRARFGDLHRAIAAPDLELGACVPHTWVAAKGSQPGLVHGRHSRDGLRGAYLVRFDWHPGMRVDAGGLADAAVRLVFRAGARRTAQTPLDGFQHLDGPVSRTYRQGERMIRVTAGIDPRGAGLVALVFGPRDYMQTDEPTSILDSVTYDPAD